MSAVTDPSPWVTVNRSDPAAPTRLLCLPAAGGGGAAYHDWTDRLAGAAEVAVLCLPGRDARRAEPAYDDLPTLVRAAADGIVDWWQDDPRPVTIFGHSMGALLGFELVREAQRRWWGAPAALIASGRRAPHLPYDPARRRLHQLSTPDLIAHLRRRGGTPAELLADPEIFAIFEPTLRADLCLVESYDYVSQSRLVTPIVGYRGVSDPDLTVAEVDAWQQETVGPFLRRDFAGGHFFHIGAEAVLASLRTDLDARVPACSLA